ncbi:type II toxin-antitoxin system HicB family antitoxin [Lactobacillus sp. ESL0791]|uniref:type II toxin-antitoxin system HicB family antitoxin n=1 Tax=Lactobacillus sp. ESL0791 TaxID=2983234 RepID=UPI0023F7D8E1|nr:type II toxin-antitoxin system HicB family antitoxin [Lactobacillus sp. ESL0791]MDF7639037.1 type II toxin-antitoxin system HicB family antitoxin [Lactobacillus sp. ESL0791]
MKNKDFLTYPIILHPENEGGYSVEIPDVEGGTWTQGDDMADAIYMASDAIGALLVGKDEYPKPSKLEDIKTDSKAIKTVTSVNMSKYRKLNAKTIRKQYRYLNILLN